MPLNLSRQMYPAALCRARRELPGDSGKRTFLCWLVVASVVAAQLALVRPASASAVSEVAPYQVTDIGAFAPDKYSYSVGINGRGDVIGQVGSSAFVPFLYRGGTAIRLVPPKGITSPLATGINDRDVMAVEARNRSGVGVAFAVRPSQAGFTWIRLQLPGVHPDYVSVVSVASNGDIDGTYTRMSSDGSVILRCVLWRAKEDGTYAPGDVLPLSRGYDVSVAGGIWRRNGVTYVAGAQGNHHGQEATVWSPAPRLAGLQGSLPFASTVSGTVGHVFAAGTTWGQGQSYAWFSRIHFSSAGIASFEPITILERFPGYLQAVGLGVTADERGNPMVVGDLVNSNAASRIRAVLWEDESIIKLQSLIPRPNHWTLTEAAGINSSRQIAGQGVIDGQHHAVLLSPVK